MDQHGEESVMERRLKASAYVDIKWLFFALFLLLLLLCSIFPPLLSIDDDRAATRLAALRATRSCACARLLKVFTWVMRLILAWQKPRCGGERIRVKIISKTWFDSSSSHFSLSSFSLHPTRSNVARACFFSIYSEATQCGFYYGRSWVLCDVVVAARWRWWPFRVRFLYWENSSLSLFLILLDGFLVQTRARRRDSSFSIISLYNSALFFLFSRLTCRYMLMSKPKKV